MAFDLIADVMRAADRTALAQAQARLHSHATKPAKPARPTLFASVAAQFAGKATAPKDLPTDLVADVMAAAKPAAREMAMAKLGASAGERPGMDPGMEKAMQGLQSALLTTMVDSMVPKEQTSLYGEGTAGDIWRGFQVNQFADALSKSDVLNLNTPRQTAAADANAVGRVTQWPYFQSGSITSFEMRS